MRKKSLFFSIVLFEFLITGCSNKLNVLAPYKSITVVYGLMDQHDTAHYIRVNKAYEGNGDAYTMAQQFDSIYFPANQITVQLQEYNSMGNWVATINLTPDSSIPVQPGTFSYPKQILYKTKAALSVLDIYSGNNTYNLIITNEHTHQVLTGSTTLLPDIVFTSSSLNAPTFPMSFSSTYPSQITWTSIPQGRIYQMILRFYYNETSTPSPGEKYIDWIFAPQTANTINGNEPMVYEYDAQQFLQLIKTSIPIINSAQRTADSISVMFTTGSDDFNTYIQLSQPSLSIDPDPPSFSDVKNGIGIFTSRHLQIITKPLSIALIDTLVNSSTMAPYDFVAKP